MVRSGSSQRTLGRDAVYLPVRSHYSRIRKLSDDLRKICQGELDSEFLDIAKKLWAEQESTGTGHVLNEIGTFHVEQPG